MSDKTDPRLAVLDEVLRHAESGEGLPYRWDAAYALRLLDAADRTAGVVRVDTNDEALVERIARDVWEKNGLNDAGYGPWEEAQAWDKDSVRDSVRAVLAALREAS